MGEVNEERGCDDDDGDDGDDGGCLDPPPTMRDLSHALAAASAEFPDDDDDDVDASTCWPLALVFPLHCDARLTPSSSSFVFAAPARTGPGVDVVTQWGVRTTFPAHTTTRSVKSLELRSKRSASNPAATNPFLPPQPSALAGWLATKATAVSRGMPWSRVSRRTNSSKASGRA
eukprot:CAMPEP_0171865228 /NCGR_PEP_ID=MMETSP0992-20121227/29397_1 /TAXON_ID=483369 /ORGANISM="non described non described, Strain CCMP2098" /LENGTH=173 /DNA_ID=CAMNT_0012488089 /DNA_START=94 /DNA_END=615 /DNA_ORIENTATION=+